MKRLCLSAFLLSLFNIGVAKAMSIEQAQKIEVESNCEAESCVVEMADFSFTIEEITLVDEENHKIADLDDWDIDPELYKGSDETSSALALNLNLDVPDLKNIIKEYSNDFDGYINIKYKLDLKNKRNYTYRWNNITDLFTALITLNLDDYLVTEMPMEGSFNYNIVSLKDDKLEILADKDTSSDDAFSLDIAMLMIISSDEKINSESSESLSGTVLVISSEEITEENLENVEDYINNDLENDDITIDDTADQEKSQEEKSNESSPDTNIVSNLILLILGMGGIILFIYTNNKILKRKI